MPRGLVTLDALLHYFLHTKTKKRKQLHFDTKLGIQYNFGSELQERDSHLSRILLYYTKNYTTYELGPLYSCSKVD